MLQTVGKNRFNSFTFYLSLIKHTFHSSHTWIPVFPLSVAPSPLLLTDLPHDL